MKLSSTIKTHVQQVLIALVIFFIATFLFCKPAFDGKIIRTTDGDQFSAMVQQMGKAVEAQDGKLPIWNKNLFAGMPFFFEDINLSNPVFKFVFNVIVSKLFLGILGIGTIAYPAVYFWIACLSFFVLGSVLKLHQHIKIISSLVFAFSLQMSVLVIAGHHTKLMSMALLPMLVSGFLLVFNKRYYLGVLLGILSLYGIIIYEHYQMLFYSLLTIFFVAIGYLVNAIKTKQVGKQTLHAFLYSVLIVVIAFAFFLPKMLSYEEYSKETIRSGSKIIDLKANAAKPTGGLDKSYAFAWSYGIAETLTFFSPDVFGGTSNGKLKEEAASVKKLTELGVSEEQALSVAKSFSTYWGEQPFTLGPIYFGVLVCILAILAIIYIRSWLVITMASLTLFTIFIAWGKNFAFFNFFIFDHLPLYNKFRAPTMIFTITQFSITVLMACALQYFFIDKIASIDFKKLLKYCIYTCGVLLGMLSLLYINSNFSSTNDAGFFQQLKQMVGGKDDIAKEILAALKIDRKSLLLADIMKFIFIASLLIAALYAYSINKIKANVVIILFGAIMVIDNIQESKDYLSADVFQDKPADNDNVYNSNFPMSEADKTILKDKDPNYRVLDLSSRSLFSDASASYYHKSIGGYFPAKLAIYQDLIDSQLSKGNPAVLNMLNTKYIIKEDDKGNKAIQANAAALGACWFVQKVSVVDDTKQEMMALNAFNPQSTAFVERKYQALLPSKITPDANAKIISTNVAHDKMQYQSESTYPQFAVFSEIFYDKTWQAFIDNVPVPTIKTNYVLRGLNIPAGKHTITFKNELKTYKKGIIYQSIASFLFIAFLVLFLYVDVFPFFKKNKTANNQ